MKDETALKPSFLNIASFKQEEEANKAGASIEEKQLYGLTNLAGWKIFSDFKDRVFQEIDNTNSIAMAEGKSFEEIGRNTVVINLAKEIVNKIFNKVKDAKDACEAKIDEKKE